MEIYLIKTGFGLRGWTPEDEDKLRKIKANDVVKCELTKPRNVLFHRKFFALLQLTFENQVKYSNLEDLLIEVKLKGILSGIYYRRWADRLYSKINFIWRYG